MPSIQVDNIPRWYEAVKDGIMVDHWKELGLDLDLKGDVDVDSLAILEDSGQASVITARDRGDIVGYLLAIHRPHLHYKSSPPVFIVDMYYVAPEYRKGLGVRLLMYMQAYAKRIGAIKIYLSCKVHKDHSELFKKMGFKLSDYAFVKRI